LFRQGLAIAYLNTATAWARVGKMNIALEQSSQGLGIMRGLVQSASQNAFQRGIYAAVLVARGTVLIEAKKPGNAIAELASARSMYEALSKSSPDQRTNVAACDVKLGEASAAAGHDQNAADYFHQALNQVESLIAVPDADLDSLYVAADAHAGLG